MKKLILLFIPLIFLLNACEKSPKESDKLPESIDSLVHHDVLKVEGPSTSLINQSVTLTVYYPTASGCEYVSKFMTEIDNRNILIKAYGGIIRNAFCTFEAVPKTINYNFTPTEKGQFIFKFINRDNSIISHSLRVD